MADLDEYRFHTFSQQPRLLGRNTLTEEQALQAIISLEIAWTSEEADQQGSDWSFNAKQKKDFFQTIFRDKEGVLVLAEQSSTGIPVGFGLLSKQMLDDASLEPTLTNGFVLKGHRGKKLATEITRRRIEIAGELGYPALYVEPNPRSQSLMEQFNFRPHGGRYWRKDLGNPPLGIPSHGMQQRTRK